VCPAGDIVIRIILFHLTAGEKIDHERNRPAGHHASCRDQLVRLGFALGLAVLVPFAAGRSEAAPDPGSPAALITCYQDGLVAGALFGLAAAIAITLSAVGSAWRSQPA
jgi:hypothetical protein